MISQYDLYSIQVFYNTSSLKAKNYTLFISGYNSEKMVHDAYNAIHASKKIWCIFPDYTFALEELPDSEYFQMTDLPIDSDTLESEYINSFIEEVELLEYLEKDICIDITGFVKPYMIYLIYALKEYGFTKIDIIYSEPRYWEKLDETIFSKETIIKTRPINGFEIRKEPFNKDLHIIAAGYDHKLIRAASSYNKLIKNKKVLIGFPSLQPSMYQENILNFQKASDELSIDYENFDPWYAPANDPFETAKTLKHYIDIYIDENSDVNSIYLSPLSTKPHALGMLLFFLYEKEYYKERGIDIIILYPFTRAYSASSGKEVAKINLYTLEF